jgi:hypothetical protein
MKPSKSRLKSTPPRVPSEKQKYTTELITEETIIASHTEILLKFCRSIYHPRFLQLCNGLSAQLLSSTHADSLRQSISIAFDKEINPLAFKPNAKQLRDLQVALQQRAVRDNEIEQQSLELALNTYASYSEQLKKNPVHKADTPRLWTRMLSMSTRVKLSLCLHIKALHTPLSAAEQLQLQTLVTVFQESTQPPAITDAAATQWVQRLQSGYTIRLDDIIVTSDLLSLNNQDSVFLEQQLSTIKGYAARKRELDRQRHQQIQRWCQRLSTAYDATHSSSVFRDTRIDKTVLSVPNRLLDFAAAGCVSGTSIDIAMKPLARLHMFSKHLLHYRAADLQPLFEAARHAQQSIRDFSIDTCILKDLRQLPQTLKQVMTQSTHDHTPAYFLKHNTMHALKQCLDSLKRDTVKLNTLKDVITLLQQQKLPSSLQSALHFMQLNVFHQNSLPDSFAIDLDKTIASSLQVIQDTTYVDDIIIQLITYNINHMNFNRDRITQFLLDTSQPEDLIENTLKRVLRRHSLSKTSTYHQSMLTRLSFCFMMNIPIDYLNRQELRQFTSQHFEQSKQHIMRTIDDFPSIKRWHQEFNSARTVYLCLPVQRDGMRMTIVTQQDALQGDDFHTRDVFIDRLKFQLQSVERHARQIDRYCQSHLASLHSHRTYAEQHQLPDIARVIKIECLQMCDAFNSTTYLRAKKEIENHNLTKVLDLAYELILKRLAWFQQLEPSNSSCLYPNFNLHWVRLRLSQARYQIENRKFTASQRLQRPNGFYEFNSFTLMIPERTPSGNCALIWVLLQKRLAARRQQLHANRTRPLRPAPRPSEQPFPIMHIAWRQRPNNVSTLKTHALNHFLRQLLMHHSFPAWRFHRDKPRLNEKQSSPPCDDTPHTKPGLAIATPSFFHSGTQKIPQASNERYQLLSMAKQPLATYYTSTEPKGHSVTHTRPKHPLGFNPQATY